MAEEQPNRPRNKPTKAERRRRIDITESLLIDCASLTDTRRYFAEKENLRLGRRTVQRYRELAEQRIEKTAQPIREQEIRLARLRLERCYARAITGGKKNIFAAIGAQKALIALLGLNAPNDAEDEITTQELARQIVLQRREMDLYRKGASGIRSEISELFERYRSLGENPAALLQQLLRRIPPPIDPNEG